MIDYFTDPVLFAPTIGSMLMCFTAAIIGAFVVLKKESLLGEALSHTAYPGVIVALLLVQWLLPQESSSIAIELVFVLMGAFIASIGGIYSIAYLQKKKVVPDASLACVLSSFFGLGMLLLSCLQTLYPTLYRKLQAYLFGQVATMVHIHVVMYAIFACTTCLIIFFFIRPLKITIFDPSFASCIGIRKNKVEALLFFLIVLATVAGIRSVGVILLASMLIFPAAGARFFVKKISHLLLFSACFGILCGFFGVVLSHELSSRFSGLHQKVLSFPTGPMIVICAGFLFLLTALFAPKRGLFIRGIRKMTFSYECRTENLVKAIWKYCKKADKRYISINELMQISSVQGYFLHWLLYVLRNRGLLRKIQDNEYELTAVGMLWGRKLVRLHRLWEVYLVEFCKFAKDRVHPLAEEMEHILTEEMEHELTQLLKDPMLDPHNAPIPRSIT